MAPAKFERILSVSSEDPAFPAENLLKKDYSDKKWKCKKAGEKQISVVIQLEKAELITAVDVGNNGSAFVEILVGKSSTPDEYKVLVVTSSLMSLQDSKLGNNLSNVRFFKEDGLVKEVLSEKWDRIKVVCSQPYNKILQYGLAFLVVHTASVPSDKGVPVLGNFQLKNKENSDSLSIGSLFARRKEITSNDISGASAIRIASTTGVLEKRTSLASPSYTKLNYASDSDKKNEQLSVLRKKSPKREKKPRSSSPKHRGKNSVDVNSGSGSPLTNGNLTKGRSRDESRVKASDSSKKPPPPHQLQKPFNKLFEGVIFTISGFQNPYRSELRSKALQMGAKYRPDWDNMCTHLLCAFPNTPKFDQVLGHGKIVTKFWIEHSYDRRMRLPWRRFALHPPDKNLPESEEEIFEFVERPPSPIDNRRRISFESSSGPDTEEEIERVLERQRGLADEKISLDNNDILQCNNENDNNDDRLNQPSSSTKEEKQDNKVIKPFTFPKNDSPQTKKNKKTTVTSKRSALNDTCKKSPVLKKKKKVSNIENMQLDDIYNMDTEEEDESWDSKVFNLPHLPEFFKGKYFYICSDICEEEVSKLHRYILAHQGGLMEEDDLKSKEVSYLIANTIDEVAKVKKCQPDAIPVRPEWIWKAHDEGRIPPSTSFEITQ